MERLTAAQYRAEMGLTESEGEKGKPKRKRTGRAGFAGKKHECDGYTFDSTIELERYGELKNLLRAGLIENLEVHPRFEVFINGEKLCHYTADFRYFDKELGKVVIEDVKSIATQNLDPYYKLRKRAAELEHNIEVTEVVR